MNERIRYPKIQLIDEGGKIVGEVITSEALKQARQSGLDLVVLNRKVYPPIAKILDWGKYFYQINKSKKKSAKVAIKEIQLKINIGEHDFQTKLKQAKKFLKKYGKIKLSAQLKGRENIYPEKAHELLERFRQQSNGSFEMMPKRLGSNFIAIIRDENENQKNFSQKNQSYPKG